MVLVLVGAPAAGKSYFSKRLREAAAAAGGTGMGAAPVGPSAVVPPLAPASSVSAPSSDAPAPELAPAPPRDGAAPIAITAMTSGAAGGAAPVPSGAPATTPRAAQRVWVRVNQDELGTRRRCEDAARDALLAGHSVIVDRTNINPEQRAHWFRVAGEVGLPAACVHCLYFYIPIEVRRELGSREARSGVCRS